MKHLKLYEAFSGDKHPIFKKLAKFLNQFPDNATNWGQATDEVRDIARMAREFYTEIDLDMLHDEWETNPKAPQPLDFRKIKTPAEWNKQGKKYTFDTLAKMSDSAKDSFMHSLKDNEWIK